MKRPKAGPRQVTEFRKAARALGADETPERFDAALRVVGQAKVKGKTPLLRPVRRVQPKVRD